MPTQPDRPLPCLSCRYDLRGLNERGVCPECSSPIAQSIAASHQAVAPPKLRLLAIGYFTSVAMFSLVMWSVSVLPFLSPAKVPNLVAIADRATIGLLVVWLLGWILIFVMEERSRRLAISIGVTQYLIIAVWLFQPALGQ